ALRAREDARAAGQERRGEESLAAPGRRVPAFALCRRSAARRRRAGRRAPPALEPRRRLHSPFDVLDRKRGGATLSAAETEAVVAGATDGSWGDAELAAFLMAAAVRGLDLSETRALTAAMLDSGERWDLAAAHPGVVDKHSTGGVGDKVSLVLAPL